MASSRTRGKPSVVDAWREEYSFRWVSMVEEVATQRSLEFTESEVARFKK